MKNIKVQETLYDVKSMYRKANTNAERALLGFMIKAGLTNDTIFGGAFAVIHAVENCHGLYRLLPYCDSKENERKIIYIVEKALDGEWDDFTISKKDIAYYLKRIADYQ